MTIPDLGSIRLHWYRTLSVDLGSSRPRHYQTSGFTPLPTPHLSGGVLHPPVSTYLPSHPSVYPSPYWRGAPPTRVYLPTKPPLCLPLTLLEGCSGHPCLPTYQATPLSTPHPTGGVLQPPVSTYLPSHPSPYPSPYWRGAPATRVYLPTRPPL